LHARLAQFHFNAEYFRPCDQVLLALTQRLANDATAAKVTAEKARNSLEQLYRDESLTPRKRADFAAWLSLAHAEMGEKDSALELAERAIMLLPPGKDAMLGPAREENLALIQMMFGEDTRAISSLTVLLQTPYVSYFYGFGITPALLRLDPIWDPLRADPAFQKLCEEKQK